ncbi:hypothetical protein PILCRDRAFT_17171 [Piloderma croceum F 1598]|uniref:F-box domain-containing protein n=1 Tax=Piloderma croceum (strain F 1598) TaxID=765440 RepID=A0A0C3EF85_PILCF|nr:hypothetical protein PILCRDRAFT_17171 [Piloderma croceum F 1598]
MVRSTAKKCLPRPVNKLSRSIDRLSALPTEILAILFKLAAEPGVSILYLSHVSHRFRALAVHTPSLWVNICISKWGIRSKELLALYLTRSQELPLNIALSFSSKQSHYYDDEESDDGWGSNDDDGEYLVVFRALLKALIPHVPRWRRLSIHLSTAKITFGTAMRFLETIQAPCLESFEIDHTRSRSYSPDFAPLKRGAPSLSSVTLHGIGMCVGYPPLKSVKCLDIDTSDSGKSFDMSDLHYILARSSSLTRLTIGGSFDFDDECPVHM